VGYIKDQVYVLQLPAMLENLKDRKLNAVGNVHHELLESVWQETQYRFDGAELQN
jgi:hypothetical protein